MTADYTLITGAASGIGQRTAIQLSENNYLILCDKNKEGLDRTLENCMNHPNHLIWESDLEKIDNIKESLSLFLIQNQANIESFVHCAGIMKVMHMKNVDYKNALQIFNVNFFSAVEIISTLLKKRINADKLKNIIFISAILSKFGAKGHNLYSATKAALDGLMRSLAIELAPGTRINSILPGGVRTPMSEFAYSDPLILEKVLHDYPLGIGESEDIANMVEFLLSAKARWITGQQFIVDGGRTINFSQK